MLTNREMNSVGLATRQSYTTANDAFVAWAGTQQIQLGTDHTTLDQFLVRDLVGEVFATRMAFCGTLCCCGVPRQSHILKELLSSF